MKLKSLKKKEIAKQWFDENGEAEARDKLLIDILKQGELGNGTKCPK